MGERYILTNMNDLGLRNKAVRSEYIDRYGEDLGTKAANVVILDVESDRTVNSGEPYQDAKNLFLTTVLNQLRGDDENFALQGLDALFSVSQELALRKSIFAASHHTHPVPFENMRF